MPRRSLRLLGLGAAIAVMMTMSGCAAAEPSIEVGADTVIVDVRTPAEYAGGHLDGAVNIDLQSSSFATEISQLDPDADYIAYCQSGNRSAQAVVVMQAEGLSVQDAGGISEAEEATGLPIVR